MKHLKIGDIAPAFESVDQNGNIFSSKSLNGKRRAVYFYPKDMTPGCTTQACNLKNNYESLTANNITIIGVSMDDSKKHTKFIEKYELPFTLLADTERTVIDAYGVWGEKKFMGKIYDGIHRTTFVIDENDKIVGIIEKPQVKAHSEEILDFFK